jgi:type III secretory pathway component EscT
MRSVVATVAQVFAGSGVDLVALGLAWARSMPAVAIVPAFGLRALPGPARAIVGLALAAAIFPALTPVEGGSTHPWPFAALIEVARGLPVAISAAVPLWAATMVGGVADTLRGVTSAPAVPVVEGRATTLGVPMSLLASAIFLTQGGPARIAHALASRPLSNDPFLAAVNDLVAGVTLAVSLGAPLLCAGVVIEVAAALIARAASPSQVHMLLAPLRSLGTLAIAGIVLDRIASALALAISRAP